jgi:hypothetical protein
MFVFAGVRVGVIRVIGGKKFFFSPKEADESEGWGDGVCFCVNFSGREMYPVVGFEGTCVNSMQTLSSPGENYELTARN